VKNKYHFSFGAFLFAIVAGVIAFLVLVALFNLIPKLYASFKTNHELEKEKQTLVDRKSKLESDIQKLTTDRGIEEEIRNRFNVGKEGEDAFVVVEDNKNNSTKENTEKNQGFLTKIWSGFLGWFQ